MEWYTRYAKNIVPFTGLRVQVSPIALNIMAKLKYTKDFLQPIIAECFSYYEVLRKLKLPYSGSNNSYIRERVKIFNISTSHFTGSVWSKGKILLDIRMRPEEILSFDRLSGRREKANKLKKALIDLGVEYKCLICNLNPEWNGQKLVLQVDHIDGNGLNNCKENLRFLCPNCHSQTSTFGTRNIKRNVKL